MSRAARKRRRKLRLMKLFWGDGSRGVTVRPPEGRRLSPRTEPYMKPTNRKKPARPQIRRERRESSSNANGVEGKLGKREQRGERGTEGRRRGDTSKAQPSCQPHPRRTGEREGQEKETGAGAEGEVTKERGKENTSESSNQEKSRWFCLSQ